MVCSGPRRCSRPGMAPTTAPKPSSGPKMFPANWAVRDVTVALIVPRMPSTSSSTNGARARSHTKPGMACAPPPMPVTNRWIRSRKPTSGLGAFVVVGWELGADAAVELPHLRGGAGPGGEDLKDGEHLRPQHHGRVGSLRHGRQRLGTGAGADRQTGGDRLGGPAAGRREEPALRGWLNLLGGFDERGEVRLTAPTAGRLLGAFGGGHERVGGPVRQRRDPLRLLVAFP